MGAGEVLRERRVPLLACPAVQNCSQALVDKPPYLFSAHVFRGPKGRHVFSRRRQPPVHFAPPALAMPALRA
jgi:hypothetical protein